MNYTEIFELRGGSYHQAMQRWPEARRDDFLVPLQWLAPLPGEKIVDVPAGGGYLRHHLPNFSRWFGHEPCASFTGGAATTAAALLPLPWPDAFADAAVSIAGVHHLPDLEPLLRELRRVLKRGGRLLLADVHEDSAVARFLDAFVGRHNTTGHVGHYLGEHTLQEQRRCGWRVERAQRVTYGWWFSGLAELAGFCRMLFDLNRVTDDDIIAAVEEHLGLQSGPRGIGLNWELFVVLAHAD